MVNLFKFDFSIQVSSAKLPFLCYLLCMHVPPFILLIDRRGIHCCLKFSFFKGFLTFHLFAADKNLARPCEPRTGSVSGDVSSAGPRAGDLVSA